jgi:hypothetical protein
MYACISIGLVERADRDYPRSLLCRNYNTSRNGTIRSVIVIRQFQSRDPFAAESEEGFVLAVRYSSRDSAHTERPPQRSISGLLEHPSAVF